MMALFFLGALLLDSLLTVETATTQCGPNSCKSQAPPTPHCKIQGFYPDEYRNDECKSHTPFDSSASFDHSAANISVLENRYD